MNVRLDTLAQIERLRRDQAERMYQARLRRKELERERALSFVNGMWVGGWLVLTGLRPEWAWPAAWVLVAGLIGIWALKRVWLTVSRRFVRSRRRRAARDRLWRRRLVYPNPAIANRKAALLAAQRDGAWVPASVEPHEEHPLGWGEPLDLPKPKPRLKRRIIAWPFS
jgi:hypothetical protein